MSLPTTFSNILIEGNTIDAGASTDGVTTTQFTYANLLTTLGDCRIFNNYWSGITNNTSNTYMITMLGDACNIHGNTFVRGNSAITAYIRTNTSIDQMITGNIFDGYTPDGVTNTLVTNLSPNSLYTNNKNQVGYAIIPLGTNKSTLYDVTASITPFYVYNAIDFTSLANTLGVTSGAFFDDYVLKIFEADASPLQRIFSIGVNLSSYVPSGAKIIDAKFSVYNPSGIALDTSGTNQFSLALSAGRNHTDSLDTKTYQSSGISTWMLGFNASANLIINSGNEANMRSNFQTIEIPTLNFSGLQTNSVGSTTTASNADISSNYVSGNDYGLTAKLSFFYKASAQGTDTIPLIVMSPLIVTYVF